MKTLHTTALLLALTAAGAAHAADAPDTTKGLTEAQVRQLLTDKGYTKVDDVDFENGMWQANATSANGKHTEVRVDPASRQVYADAKVSSLSQNDVKAKLTAEGYSKVHDVDFEDGMWQAKAERADGKNVKVHLSPDDGRVLNVEND